MTPDDSQPERLNLLWPGVTALLFGYSLWLRVVDLTRVPGINGDEAWYGVQMQRVAEGQWVWRTPSGTPLSPFFSGIVLTLEAPFGPSYWILRAPAAMAGILCVAAGWWLMRRARDAESAWLFALILAVLPTNLAYARLGWDPSLVTLAALPICYFLWRGRFGAALVAGLVAVWVYPANVFLAPLVAACWLSRLASSKDGRLYRYLWIIPAGLVALALLLWLVPAARGIRLGAVAARLASPGDWGLFALYLAELFSGTTVYQYLVSDQPWQSVAAHDAVAWIVGITAAFGLWHGWRAGDRKSIPFVAGTAVALVAFYLIVGLRGVQPGTERYALWSIVPICWCATMGLRAWLDLAPRTLRILTCAVALAALLSFQVRYVNDFGAHGGRSHRTFRTAQVEPKLAALDYIRTERPDGNATVFAEDWWCYWPMAYLAANDPGLRVAALPKPLEGQDIMRAASREDSFLVGFAGGPIDRLVTKRGFAWRIHTVTDPAGEPVLHVFKAGGRPK